MCLTFENPGLVSEAHLSLGLREKGREIERVRRMKDKCEREIKQKTEKKNEKQIKQKLLVWVALRTGMQLQPVSHTHSHTHTHTHTHTLTQIKVSARWVEAGWVCVCVCVCGVGGHCCGALICLP